MIPFKEALTTCLHFGKCSGCHHLLVGDPPPVWQEVLTFFKNSAYPTLHQGPPIHWRYRAKVAVRGTSEAPVIGLFKRASHEVVPIPFCLVHHPHLNQAFEKVRAEMHQKGLSPYQEVTQTGNLRYLQGVVQRKTGKVQLTFVLNTKGPDTSQAQEWQQLIQEWGEENPTFWHSLWLNFNDRSTNTILGSEWKRAWGEELLWETFEDVAVCYGPASFGQANLPLFERLLVRLRSLVAEQARVAEFYAGVGVIGLFIASRCQRVRCSEVNPFAKAYFEQSRAHLTLSEATKLSFHSGSTQECLTLLNDATTVIVDPPRKGLEKVFLSALKANASVKQLVYISCGWKAFQLDCRLLEAEGWKIRHVDGYYFFPGSDHIELLVDFERG
jgi:23S rRNA (uracil1939-C5)-methyltransferase